MKTDDWSKPPSEESWNGAGPRTEEPGTEAPPPPPPTTTTTTTTAYGAGPRIAGVFLLLNGIAVIAEHFVFKASTDGLPGGPRQAIFSILLGGLLIDGIKWAKTVALIAVALGLAVFAGFQIYNQDYFLAALQIAFSGSLLNLLIARPGKYRIAASCAVVVLYFLLEAIGFYSEITGRNLLGRYLSKKTYGTLDVVQGQELSGLQFGYTVAVPDEGWLLRGAEETKAGNPNVDRWLVQPEFDAHIMVIGETIEEIFDLDLAKYTDAVADNMVKAGKLREPSARTPIDNAGLPGNTFRLSGSIEGMELEYIVGVFAQRNFGYQLICFAAKRSFPQVEQDMDRAIKSFRLKQQAAPERKEAPAGGEEQVPK